MSRIYIADDRRYERMRYRRVGRSGLMFPEVSLGFWHNFGSIGNYENMRAICQTAFDHGITQFDLANNYGPVYGSAEENCGRILRQEGMFVSPNENEDACRILLELGFAERETVKAALRTVYAKSREQQLRFDRIFDSFFLPEDAIRAIDKKHREQELERAKARQQAERDLAGESPIYGYDDAQREAFAMLSE